MKSKADILFPPPAIDVDFGESAPSSRPITDFPYPVGDDPNSLLGSEDYLNRGGGMLFVSHAGAGKSSAIVQAAMSWGLGRPWFGIRCARPLRTLIIQAEDSDRYIGKIQASFAHASRLGAKDIELVGANVRIARVKGVSGPLFFAELKRLAAEFEPDLVVINPLYLYAQGDIGRSEFAQPFLVDLDHANKEEKWAYILVHHTGKPAAKDKSGSRPQVEDWESMYMGFGSSYLANWPRCSILLEPRAGLPGRYTLKLGKGGLNAGVTRPSATGAQREAATRIHIRHSRATMLVGDRERPLYHWEVDTDAQDADAAEATKSPNRGRPKKYEFATYHTIFPRDPAKAMTRQTLYRFAQEVGAITETGFREMLIEACNDGIMQRTAAKGGGYLYHLSV